MPKKISVKSRRQKKPTGWLRAFDGIVGLVSIVLALIVITNPSLALGTIIFLIALSFLLSSIARLINAFLADKLSNGLRVFNIILGIVLAILSGLSLAYSGLTTLVIVYLLSISLLLNGIGRLIFGLVLDMPVWARVLKILIGIASIMLSVIIFISPLLGAVTLLLMLAIGLLLNGLARIIRVIIA
ncbi:MAG: DUF308 domain-containing protein [Candidatus Nanoarchaeia archaeon]|jgi:uncharacterized membrane protein HdeD (DUF308 family)